MTSRNALLRRTDQLKVRNVLNDFCIRKGRKLLERKLDIVNQSRIQQQAM